MPRLPWKSLIFTATIIVALSVLQPSHSATEMDGNNCGDSSVDPDVRIAYCTMFLSDATFRERRPYGLSNRASGYLEKKDYAKALKDIEEAIILKPDYAIFYFNRGFVRVQMKDFDQAIRDYSRAIDLGLKNAAVYQARSEAYEAAGNATLARADAVTADQLNRPKSDVGSPVPSFTPSFDCQTNRSPDEQAICGDAELSRLDRELSDAYSRMITRLAPADAANLRREQRFWLQLRAGCRTDVKCLSSLHRVRIEQLARR